MVRVTWFRHRLMYKVMQALVDRECYFHLATALSWRHTAPCRSRSTTPPSNTQGPSRHVRAVPLDTTRPQMEKPAPTPRLWHPPCDPRTSPPWTPTHSLTHPTRHAPPPKPPPPPTPPSKKSAPGTSPSPPPSPSRCKPSCSTCPAAASRSLAWASSSCCFSRPSRTSRA